MSVENENHTSARTVMERSSGYEFEQLHDGAALFAADSPEFTQAPAEPMEWLAFKESVKSVLEQFFASSRRRAEKYSPAFSDFWGFIEATTSGGKWMRPKLVYVAYEAFGGEDWHACSQLAAAFEVLHSALLVHDDAIDRDFVRRGRPTLGAKYRDLAARAGHGQADADHAGYSAAIIAGDLLLTGSLQLATAAAVGQPQKPELLSAIHEAIFAAAAGELDDLLFSIGASNPDLPDILNMERMKTAVYSFEMPLYAGALLAGQPLSSASALAAVGRDIGKAYQIVDDVLGTFGEQSLTGKSVVSDLREGKRTILTSLAQGSDEFAASMNALRTGDGDFEGDIEAVRDILGQLGVKETALNLATELVSDAMEEALELDLPAGLLTELAEICDYVLTRRS